MPPRQKVPGGAENRRTVTGTSRLNDPRAPTPSEVSKTIAAHIVDVLRASGIPRPRRRPARGREFRRDRKKEPKAKGRCDRPAPTQAAGRQIAVVQPLGSPHSVCAITRTARVSSNRCDRISERNTFRRSRARPALRGSRARTTELRSPSAASGSIRASMHVTIAVCRRGYLDDSATAFELRRARTPLRFEQKPGELRRHCAVVGTIGVELRLQDDAVGDAEYERCHRVCGTTHPGTVPPACSSPMSRSRWSCSDRYTRSASARYPRAASREGGLRAARARHRERSNSAASSWIAR